MSKADKNAGRYFENGEEKFAKPGEPGSGTTGVSLKAPEKEFPLQDILHVLTGKMLSSSGDFDAVFDLLGYMTGYRINNLNYGDALEAVRARILQQHPKLDDAEILKAEFDPEYLEHWLKKQFRAFGNDHAPLKALHPDEKQEFAERQQMLEDMRRGPKKKKTPVRNNSLLRVYEDD